MVLILSEPQKEDRILKCVGEADCLTKPLHHAASHAQVTRLPHDGDPAWRLLNEPVAEIV